MEGTINALQEIHYVKMSKKKKQDIGMQSSRSTCKEATKQDYIDSNSEFQ